MVAYIDVPAVNVLYMEQEQINNAITMLDDGGRVMNFTVGPRPPDPGMMSSGMPMMPVMIMVPDPPAGLMDQARAALVIRQNEIIAELTALGVTEGPPARSIQRADEEDR